MGAGSTVAAAISFQSGSDKKIATKNKLDLQVQSIGFDSTLGGQAVDVLIQDYLAKAFQKTNSDKLKASIFDDSVAMARLYLILT
jgi:molecular chaperone DnaK (HSP70)